jgi:peptide chain release factor 1
MIKNHNIKIKTRHSAFCSRLYEQELAKKTAEDATKRTSQVSSGDRSNKIRTTYAQGRVTDHRVV